MGIDFNDTTQPAVFDLCAVKNKFSVTISAPVGELLQPITMSENEFNQQQGEDTHTRTAVNGYTAFTFLTDSYYVDK